MQTGYNFFQRFIGTIRTMEVKKALHYYWNFVFLDYVKWRTSWDNWLSIKRFKSFRNKHHGERCFIVGNGPSLNVTDLTILRNEVTFGLNRIYLLFPQPNFKTNYYVSVNKLVIEQSAEDINKIDIPKFLSWHARHSIKFNDNTYFVRDSYTGLDLDFSKDPSRRIWEGATVTYVALQLAFYMGFQQVILIGVDHSFVSKGEPNKVIVSDGPDLNHFDSNYFGKDFAGSYLIWRLQKEHIAWQNLTLNKMVARYLMLLLAGN